MGNLATLDDVCNLLTQILAALTATNQTVQTQTAAVLAQAMSDSGVVVQGGTDNAGNQVEEQTDGFGGQSGLPSSIQV